MALTIRLFPITVILSWLVDEVHVDGALKHDKLLEEHHIECRPEKISDAVADENVDITLVRKYLSDDAWLLLSDVVGQKKKKMLWKCNMCFSDLHSEQSINCDRCLLWFHFRCVSLTKPPKTKNWFCRACCA